MKILYVTTLGTWGGVATYLSSLINDQLIKHNDVWLIAGTNEEFTKTIMNKYPSVHVVIIPYLNHDIHILNMLKAIFIFRKIVKNIKPNIIHLNCIMAGIMGRIACASLRTPIIYNAHGWAFEPGTSKKYKWPAIIIEKFLAFFTSKIICVSDYEYKIANKYHIFKNKYQGTVIKNGSYDVKYSYSNRLNDDIFRITMAARFWNQKNQPDLIRAFYILDKQLLPKKKMILYLLGNGPTMQYCKNLVEKLGIQKNVIFTGEVNNVLDYYNDSDIITLITNYDAIAISLIEALSMGKPIVASNVSGVPENFNNNGFCIDNDPKIIAQSLKKIIIDKNLRQKMGINSRKLFLNDFIQSKNLKKHDALYNSISYSNERK